MAGFDNDTVYGTALAIGSLPGTGTPDGSYEKTTAGGEVKVQIRNNSNTAGSDALQEIRVAGTSSGDAWTQWNVGSTRTFAFGIDNSDNDELKLTTTNGATLDPSSGTFVMNVDATGTGYGPKVGYFDPTEPGLGGTDDDMWLSREKIGESLNLRVYNFDNTDTGSHAFVGINVGGTSGGDPHIGLGVPGGTTWNIGSDNTDSDKFKIGTGSNPSAATNMLAITSAGEVTFPLTPAFLAEHPAALNVTGNGTVYTYGSAGGAGMTEIFDQNSDFSPGDGAGTGAVFTASITGRYMLGISLRMSGLTAAMTTGILAIETDNRTYEALSTNYGAIRCGAGFVDNIDYAATFLCDMDASDTATFTVDVVNGAGDTADISATFTRVWGKLEC